MTEEHKIQNQNTAHFDLQSQKLVATITQPKCTIYFPFFNIIQACHNYLLSHNTGATYCSVV